MASHTEVSGLKWTHVLAIGLAAPFQLRPSHVPVDAAPAEGLLLYTGYRSWSAAGAAPAHPWNVTIGGIWNEETPLLLQPCNYSDFRLWHAAPVHTITIRHSAAAASAGDDCGGNGSACGKVEALHARTLQIALLGEPNKWVPVSVARVGFVTPTFAGDDLMVKLRGYAYEDVEVAFATRSGLRAGWGVRSITCTLPSANEVTAHLDCWRRSAATCRHMVGGS